MKNDNGSKKQKNSATIKQASYITGVPLHTIRFWEKEFKGFLRPQRTNGGQRRFDETSIKDLLTLKSIWRYYAGRAQKLMNKKACQFS